MLRDKNLIPLSHQHQRALAMCVRLNRALQEGAVELQRWQAEISQEFEREIGAHFVAEEKEVFPRAARFAEMQDLVIELLAEHAELRDLFSRARTQSLGLDGMRELEGKLAAHIRKEERRLFERMQALMNPDELAEMGAALQQALAAIPGTCALPNSIHPS
jgi:hemerythrin superfamily protein